MNTNLAWRILLTLLIFGILIILSACATPATGLELAPTDQGDGTESLATQVDTLESAPEATSLPIDTPKPQAVVSAPSVTISPTSGPPGTMVQVIATGFAPHTPVMVWMGPERAGFGEVASGVTDLNGAFSAQVPVENAPGMNLVFAVGTEGKQGASAPVMFHVTDAPGTQSLEAFELSLIRAVEAHDFGLLRSLMSDSFGFAFWRSEGQTYTPDEAIEQLRLNYLRADNIVRFQDPPDLSQQLGNRGILSVWNPAVNPVSAPFSVGWGADGRAEAFLIIAQRPDGTFYWEGILLGGFVDQQPGPYPVLETDVKYVQVLPDFVPMYDGPGDTHTQIGEIFGGMAGTVTGISADGQWWRVMCPDDTIDSCWISADPGLTQPTAPPGS